MFNYRSIFLPSQFVTHIVVTRILTGMWLFAFITIVLVADPTVYGAYSIPKTYLFVLFIPAFIFAIGILSLKITKPVFTFTLIEVLLFVRIIWIIISNDKPFQLVSSMGFIVLLSLTLLTIVTRQYLKGDTRLNAIYFARSMFFLGLVQVGIGLYQLMNASQLLSLSIKTPMIGTIGSANGYGLFLAISLVSGLYLLFLDHTTYFKKIIVFFGLSFLASAVVLNGSRGAVFALFFTGTVLFILYQTIMKRKMKVIGFLSVCLLIAFGSFLFLLNPESSYGRVMVWRLSFPMLTDHMTTGIGFGEYAREYLFYQARFFENIENIGFAYKAANLKQTHNEFFQSFFETGIPGGILFCSVWGISVFIWVKKLLLSKSEKGPENFFSWNKNGKTGQDILFISILLIIIFHSLLDTPLHVLSLSIIAYYSLSFCPVKEFKVKVANLILIFSIFLSSLLLFWVALKTGREYVAYQLWERGYEFTQNKKWVWAIQNYEKADHVLPMNGELKFNLGAAYIFNGNYSKGLGYLNSALETFTDRNIFLANSYAQLKLKNYQQAVDNAKIALSMFPDQLAPHLLLGEIYFHLGRISESKLSLTKCINEDTRIKSDETLQIQRDAKLLWSQLYRE